MPASDIIIKGAREHNLRDVELVIPRNKLICLTGVSGSGKSSLAFDTLFAEGQRRYIESLSTFARQFLGQMPKPDVDYIAGLSPSISISQKSTGNNPRSTVGTVTEIYDYLRVLFARVGHGFCPQCGRPITAQTREQILEGILQLPANTRFSLLAPLIRGQKGEHRDLFADLLKQGFVRARVDGKIVPLTDDLKLDRQMRHNIEVVIDRLVIKPDLRPRLSEAVELALKVGQGVLIAAVDGEQLSGRERPRRGASASVPMEEPDRADASLEMPTGAPVGRDIVFSSSYACSPCGLSFETPTPQLFSFNSPQGMCRTCDGLGTMFSFAPELLVPNPRLSFKDGCFELIGSWKELGRWRRHIYQGVADTMERKLEIKEGTMLESPWERLDESLQQFWLWGTGAEHITFTWRGGDTPIKYGGRFGGVVPEFLEKYRSVKSKPLQAQLEKYMTHAQCPDCRGQRLNPQARSVRVSTANPRFTGLGSRSLPEVCDLSIREAVEFFQELQLDEMRTRIAAEVLKEIRSRLGFLLNVGLDYLTLARTAPTLSGGESQRIRLASQIGSGLVGVLYILDEPSIGLHPRDNDRLISTLHRLRDMGNTVIVVEHDEDTMRASDHIVDFGPGPGVRGGEIVGLGSTEEVMSSPRSVTGDFLSGRRRIETPTQRRPLSDKRLKITGAAHNNLQGIDVEIPLGVFVCVTGVSGSGKSSLVNDVLVEALHRDLNHGEGNPGKHTAITGLQHLDKLIDIDQSPIGRTPRSNPATYIKVFDDIRDLFAQLPDAKRRGYKPGRFSFNVSGGRCEACEGNGSNKLEMDFLADVWVTCPVCEGHRFNRETLQVRFKDKSITDVLEMDVQQALRLFENVPQVRHKLQTLHDVGLDYLKLGQPSPTLSGGEAQRIKLARELVKKSTGQTLYLLDEPTTGLHFADIQLLLKVLHDFVNAGNTVLVVEHNLDVIKTADWIIDLGPEGGAGGGQIVAQGTPEEVAKHLLSPTGRALAKLLADEAAKTASLAGPAEAATPAKPGRKGAGKKSSTVVEPVPSLARRKSKPLDANTLDAKATGGQSASAAASGATPFLCQELTVRGARQHNLRGVDVRIERDKMTVFCGPSGSGKSSLAMDTIYAEGQRRYVESLSAYARQFVAQMQKPQLDHIEGLSPAIAIEQKNLGHTPRSTVGTVTEIYDYLRVLIARLGIPHCPQCELEVGTQTADQVIEKLMALPLGTRMYLMAPIAVEVGEKYDALWEELRTTGYIRVRVDGVTHSLEKPPEIDRRRQHKVEVVVDRVIVSPQARSRIADSAEKTLALGKGVLVVAYQNEDLPEPQWETVTHSQHLACHQCGRSFEPLSPHSFSFNTPLGWCPGCEGLGTQRGANPTALVRDPKMTLADGALLLWPSLEQPVAKAMLSALSRGAALPLDVPFEKLGTRARRALLHGCGEQWFQVEGPVSFRFQFKGLYPALEEASHLSPTLRGKLEQLVAEVECSTCGGSRLRDDAGSARFRGLTMDQLCRMPLGELQQTLRGWKLTTRDRKIAGELLREIQNRVEFLVDVGLEYLSLSRAAATLSNGEAQRIRLASQLGSGLCGVLYVLDEPTIGLHPRDNRRLLGALHKLRDLGNTLIVVEHDRDVIAECDYLCDFGPGAGKLGGNIVAEGAPSELPRRPGSVTGPYLDGSKAITVPTNRRVTLDLKAPLSADAVSRGVRDGTAAAAVARARTASNAWLRVEGVRHNNLRNIELAIPCGTLTAITGPSGSGKSSLIEDVLYAAAARILHRAAAIPGAFDSLHGLEHINKVIRVDQQPLGNSPTSNPATFTGVFELIRQLYSQLPDAKVRGYTARRFSFNVSGGRCEACEGNGQKRIEMHFLPDVWVECDTCRGKRYNPETLAVAYHGHSINDVLNMTCGEAAKLFENIPKIRRILRTLCDVGLDYLTLGQAAPTLSGGEAQRVKLAAELSRPDTGRTLYLLDEPTTGLHFDDISRLLDVMHRLVDLGNTVVVIEHNLDVIKQCDWVVDLGPEAGAAGGLIVAAGTPEEIVRQARKGDPRSHTGEALRPVIEAGPRAVRVTKAADDEQRQGDLEIEEVGKDARMPWEVDGRKWHTRDRVGRTGEACRWDGKILESVVDRIHEQGEFAETDWSARSVVEITAKKKSDGWFFHAITGETWLLKMKFRVARSTFSREALLDRIQLKTLNEMHDLPIYGNEPRVRCKNLGGPWQEVEIRAHTFDEIDTPQFWSFLDDAVKGFYKQTDRAAANPEDAMPWKVLGRKWHFLRKGFPPGKKIVWDEALLEEMCEMLSRVAPGGQFLWNNQQLVHYIPPDRREPWATLLTKKPEALILVLTGPKNAVTLGRVAELGFDRELDGSSTERDQIKIRFRTKADLERGDLEAVLEEHLAKLA
ncbi:MAG: excinuclease ABC subunit UvrA [Pirellulales bacterium]